MIEHKLSNVLLKPADHLKGHDELYAFCSSMTRRRGPSLLASPRTS